MNLIKALSAYPFEKLPTRMSYTKLLALGHAVLIVANVVLASNSHWGVVLSGVALWFHMRLT